MLKLQLFGGCKQLPPAQESFVQTLPSSQSMIGKVHLSLAQVSLVQGSASLQTRMVHESMQMGRMVLMQFPLKQLSVVQVSPSSQMTGV